MVLLPNLAATSTCTRTSAWVCNSFIPSSVLAKAYAILPVRRLVFIGGSIPNISSSPANLGLLIRSPLLAVAANNSFSLFVLTFSRCCSSIGSSSISTGSVNILIVMSTTSTSISEKFFPNLPSKATVSSTSLIQYLPYLESSSGVNVSRRLPRASSTSVPFAPRPYRSTNTLRLLPTSTPCIARPILRVSNHFLGLIPHTHDKIAPSNEALCANAFEVSQGNCFSQAIVSANVPLNH